MGMRADEFDARRDRIVKLFRDGVDPVEIGQRLGGMRPDAVRRALKAAGVDPNEPPTPASDASAAAG
jgi:hypothetical protein